MSSAAATKKQQQQQKTAPPPPAAAPPPAEDKKQQQQQPEGDNTAEAAAAGNNPMAEFAQAFKTLQALFKPMQAAYARMEKEAQKKANKKEKRGGSSDKKGVMPAAFMKPVLMSNELCKVLGKPEGTKLPRSEVFNEVKSYLNSKNACCPENRSMYTMPAELKALFPAGEPEAAPEVDKVRFLSLQKLLKGHLSKVEDAPAASSS